MSYEGMPEPRQPVEREVGDQRDKEIGNDVKKDNAIGWVTELRIVETVISGKECRPTKAMQ